MPGLSFAKVGFVGWVLGFQVVESEGKLLDLAKQVDFVEWLLQEDLKTLFRKLWAVFFHPFGKELKEKPFRPWIRERNFHFRSQSDSAFPD